MCVCVCVLPVSCCVRSGETGAASRSFSGVLWHEEELLEGVGEALVTSASASVMTGLRLMPESAELCVCMQGASRLVSSSSMLLSIPAVVDNSSWKRAESKISGWLGHTGGVRVITGDSDAGRFLTTE